MDAEFKHEMNRFICVKAVLVCTQASRSCYDSEIGNCNEAPPITALGRSWHWVNHVIINDSVRSLAHTFSTKQISIRHPSSSRKPTITVNNRKVKIKFYYSHIMYISL